MDEAGADAQYEGGGEGVEIPGRYFEQADEIVGEASHWLPPESRLPLTRRIAQALAAAEAEGERRVRKELAERLSHEHSRSAAIATVEKWLKEDS